MSSFYGDCVVKTESREWYNSQYLFVIFFTWRFPCIGLTYRGPSLWSKALQTRSPSQQSSPIQIRMPSGSSKTGWVSPNLYRDPPFRRFRSAGMETSTRSVRAEDPTASSSEIPSWRTRAATSVFSRTWRISSARPTSMSNVSYSNLIKQEARRETGDGASHAHLSPLSQIYWAVKYVL